MATADSADVQFVRLDDNNDGTSPIEAIEKSSKRRRQIKLGLILFLFVIIIAVTAYIIYYFVTNDGSSSSNKEDVEYKWDSEIKNDEFESYSDEYKQNTFKKWKKDNNRSYETDEEHNNRYNIWHAAWKLIADTNSQNLSHKLRMNKFGDLTQEEFGHYYLGNLPENNETAQLPPFNPKKGRRRNLLQTSLDWAYDGYVTPIKNQGECGSCWAFSATGNIECNTAIYNYESPVSLSEQELIDCTEPYGNKGCDGGLTNEALLYAQNNGGLCKESAYPYISEDSICRSSSCLHNYNDAITAYSVTANDESALQTAVQSGCVSVAVEADGTSFQYYSSGILTSSDCGTSIDHAILIVGYGEENGVEYWRVKNEWGTSWGESGYIRICKNCAMNGYKGQCGINTTPYIAQYS